MSCAGTSSCIVLLVVVLFISLTRAIAYVRLGEVEFDAVQPITYLLILRGRDARHTGVQLRQMQQASPQMRDSSSEARPEQGQFRLLLRDQGLQLQCLVYNTIVKFFHNLSA